MKFLLLSLLALAITNFSYSQEGLSGVLMVKGESTIIPFAQLRLTETGQATLSDERGRFTFSLPGQYAKLHLVVTALGVDTVFEFTYKRNEKTVFLITLKPFELPNAEVKSLSANQIVAKALKAIPTNYLSSTYAYYSFYRQYQKVNGLYKNLIEAMPVLMINPRLVGAKLIPTIGYAVEDIRRSNFEWDINDMKYQNGLPELMAENPIYNFKNYSFKRFLMNRCLFKLDSVNADNYYITYACPSSNEDHGFEGASDGFLGESYAVGRLIIDKATFAFTYIERKTLRNDRYHYQNNNYVMPSRRYSFEFSSGDLIVEYSKVADKWHTKTLKHIYTNDYFSGWTKKFSITEVFEWKVDSVSKFIDESLIDKFYTKCNLEYQCYDYSSSSWINIPSLSFFPIEHVYRDINRLSPLEEQFRKSGINTDSLK